MNPKGFKNNCVKKIRVRSLDSCCRDNSIFPVYHQPPVHWIHINYVAGKLEGKHMSSSCSFFCRTRGYLTLSDNNRENSLIIHSVPVNS